jgi:hypothetical protein
MSVCAPATRSPDVAADDYIYGTRIDATSREADKQTQNDVQLSFGFGIPLGH